MNGVNTTVKDVKEVMGTLEERLQILSTTANTIESKLQVPVSTTSKTIELKLQVSITAKSIEPKLQVIITTSTLELKLQVEQKTSVSDPHRFYADPDPAFLLSADPDPDPTCRI
jgi:hypothetical protein